MPDDEIDLPDEPSINDVRILIFNVFHISHTLRRL
jgi:hypothetical protein